jgi:hypothetical protein
MSELIIFKFNLRERKILVGLVIILTILIGGCITEEIKKCPTCPKSSKQSRSNYKCSEETKFECAEYTEERGCELTECPMCPFPSGWSSCVDGSQDRTNYRCDASTNFQCLAFTETKACVEEVTKEQFEQKYSELKAEYREKLEQGYDVSEAKAIGERAEKAYSGGDYQTAHQLLLMAEQALNNAEIPEEPIKQCPVCSLPSEWSVCVDGRQSRSNYICSEETKFECTEVTEERFCEMPKCPSCPLPTEWSECIANLQTRTNYECSAATGYECEGFKEEQQCEIIPSEYIKWFRNQETFLDDKLNEWKPTEYDPMKFSVYQHFRGDEEFDSAFSEILFELETDMISHYVNPDFINYNLKDKSRYISQIDKIKQGRDLYLGYIAKARPYTFNDYYTTEKSYLNEYIDSFHPDYLAIVIEPRTVEIETGSEFSLEQWRTILMDMAAFVKQKDSSIRTVVDITNYEKDRKIVPLIIDDPNIDIIAFNIFGKGIIDTEYVNLINETTKRKETWIGETWLGLVTLREEGESGYPKGGFVEPLEAKWLTVITYFAQQHGITNVNPMYSHRFVTYETGKDWRDVVNDRTSTFYSYRTAIREVRTEKNNT